MKTKKVYLVRRLEIDKVTAVLTTAPRKGERIIGNLNATHCSVEVDTSGGMQMQGGKIRIPLFPKKKEKDNAKAEDPTERDAEQQRGAGA